MPKLNLKSSWYKQSRTPSRDHWLGLKGRALYAYRAAEYARWIAQRDGLTLPDVPGRVDWNRAPGQEWRPCAVWFGAVRVAIPHWDYVERPPVVEYEVDLNV